MRLSFEMADANCDGRDSKAYSFGFTIITLIPLLFASAISNVRCPTLHAADRSVVRDPLFQQAISRFNRYIIAAISASLIPNVRHNVNHISPGLVSRPQLRPRCAHMTPTWSAPTFAEGRARCAASLTPNATPGCQRMKTSPAWSGHSKISYTYLLRVIYWTDHLRFEWDSKSQLRCETVIGL